jgi:hypothetical protein
MQPCQEKMLVSQSTTVTAFQHSRVDLTSTNFRFENVAPPLLAADTTCSYTFSAENQRQAVNHLTATGTTRRKPAPWPAATSLLQTPE